MRNKKCNATADTPRRSFFGLSAIPLVFSENGGMLKEVNFYSLTRERTNIIFQ